MHGDVVFLVDVAVDELVLVRVFAPVEPGRRARRRGAKDESHEGEKAGADAWAHEHRPINRHASGPRRVISRKCARPRRFSPRPGTAGA